MKALFLISLGVVAAIAGCNRNDKEKAGQTITTAADEAVSATERTADRAVDAGARELKREWRDLDIKVETGNTPALGPRDGGALLKTP